MSKKKEQKLSMEELNQRDLFTVEEACFIFQKRFGISRSEFYAQYRSRLKFGVFGRRKVGNKVRFATLRIRKRDLEQAIHDIVENPLGWM